MRWLLPALLLRTVLGVEPAAVPLLNRANDQAQIVPALMALSRGDAAPFTALPASLFAAAAGVPDSSDPDLLRLWTSAVPAALARLPDAARHGAVEALDRRCRLLLADSNDPMVRARIAAAFLPAPSALATLASEANRAFDSGDFRRYLAITTITGSDNQRRTDTALALLGVGPVIDPASALSPPGTPIPTSTVLPLPHTGLGVRWSVVPGWLLALDPWGTVRWQYRLDAKAEVVTGDGGVLVRDGRGLRLIDEDGSASALPPAPASARLLAVAGGAAWFATGNTVHRLDFTDRHLTSLTLPAEPLSPPLVRGGDSLWLTHDDLVLVRSTGESSRIQHGLSAQRGWSLGVDGDRPLIVASDGHSWHVGALEEQLAQSSVADRLALLVRAHRRTEALELFAAEPSLADDPTCRHLALVSHLALGVEHLRTCADQVLSLTANSQERATLLSALARSDELATLCAAHPDVLIAQSQAAWDSEPDTWDHVIAGRAWSERDGLTTWLTLPPVLRAALGAAQNGTDQPIPVRQGDGSWRIGSRTLRCDAGIAYTTVEFRENDGALCWRHRWPALDPLVAPGRSLALRDTWIVLVEGAARIRVLDLGNGALLADLALRGADIAPDTVVPLGGNRIADLGPLGLDTMLHLRDSTTTTDILLPVAGRWLLPWGDHVAVALSDGRSLIVPGNGQLTLPEELRHGPPPTISRAGLAAHGHHWPWRH